MGIIRSGKLLSAMLSVLQDRLKRREEMRRAMTTPVEDMMPKAERPEPSLAQPATFGEYVRWEHRRIERRTGRLGSAVLPVEIELDEAMSQFEKLGEVWSVHSLRESKALFPRAKEKFADLVAELERQHAEIDEHGKRVEALFRKPKDARDARWSSELRTAAQELGAVVQKHLVREEDALVRALERELPPDEQLKIGQEMEQVTPPPSKALTAGI